MHQDRYEDDCKCIGETLWGMEVLHEVDADCWHVKVNNVLRNCLELKLQTSFKEIFGAELSYMIKQDEEHFTEEKHLLEKLNISTHQKNWREAAEYLGKEEVKITDSVC